MPLRRSSSVVSQLLLLLGHAAKTDLRISVFCEMMALSLHVHYSEAWLKEHSQSEICCYCGKRKEQETYDYS